MAGSNVWLAIAMLLFGSGGVVVTVITTRSMRKVETVKANVDEWDRIAARNEAELIRKDTELSRKDARIAELERQVRELQGELYPKRRGDK